MGTSGAGPSLEQKAQKEAGERRRAALEARASLLQQKLSKLKWDFRKLALRYGTVDLPHWRAGSPMTSDKTII